MVFTYKDAFHDEPEAYETLLLDVMEGDATLFMRIDQVEEAWKVIMPVLDSWQKQPFDFPNYQPGSWGPDANIALMEKRRKTLGNLTSAFERRKFLRRTLINSYAVSRL